MKKRMIAMLLSICLMFSLLPLGVVAVDESYGISEDGTVESTEASEATEETVPETSAPTEETVPETTEDDSVITDTSLRTSVDGKSFGVTGESIPEGAEFVVSIPQEDLTDALASLGLNN